MIPLIGNKVFVTGLGAEWWAEGGLVQRRDLKTGEHTALRLDDALDRLKAFNEMVANSRRRGISPKHAIYKELEQMAQFVSDMTEVVKTAIEQGRQDDPAVQLQKAEERRNKRKSRVFVTPVRA